MNKTMEQPHEDAGKGVEIKKGTMESVVGQLQTLEKALAQFKNDQEELRNLPERGEKNALLAEIEERIRTTTAMISELQTIKMNLLQEAEEKYAVPPTEQSGR